MDTALVPARLRASLRQALRQELLWEGFGAVAPGVFAHPQPDTANLHEILRTHTAAGDVALLRAQGLEPGSSQPLQALLHDAFQLGQVARAWLQFSQRFEPVLEEAASLAPAEAFIARTLLVHEYRRVVLRDPNLPAALLPPGWPGLAARTLCRALYRALRPASEQFLMAKVETLDGALARTPRSISRR